MKKEKTQFLINVPTKEYKILREEAENLNIPINKLLPALIMLLKNSELKEEALQTLFIG